MHSTVPKNGHLFPDECQTNDDCPLSKKCVRNECVDPCLTTSCGDRAECRVEYHTAVCYCPNTLQGNPLVQCINVGCRRHDDCNDDEQCDFKSQQCKPLCSPSPCAPGAQCDAKNHREHCSCISPLEGNGFVFCARRKSREPHPGLPEHVVRY